MFKSKHFLTVLVTAVLPLVVSAAFAASVPTTQLTSALHWRNVGPYFGGRVTSVAGVPGKPNVYYAGYAGGGVWMTDDYGHSWKNISDKYFKNNTSGTVGAIAIAPSDSKVIYAGTGDSAPRNTVLTGHGMYKSTDSGKTWKYIGLGDTHIISWIIVDPQNPDVVYAAALGHLFGPNPERGVFKTTDGGQTWQKVLFVNNDTGAITLAMDPQNPQVLYATMWQMRRSPWDFSSGGPGSGIYKSTDGGAHWANITHSQGLPTGIFGKVGIAVAPSNPNVVYTLIQADYKPGKPGGLFKSENGGKNWTLMNDSLDITQRAFYYMRIYVDPKDANTIYLPNVGLYVSHDSGKTLTALRPPHGDNHALWINPNNPDNFIEGNDGGATVTLTAGSSWSSEENQPTGQFYHVNLDEQFPFHIYGAQQDRGSVEGPSAVAAGLIPPVWTGVQGGEESWVVPTPGKPWVTYGDSYYGRFWRDDRRAGTITNVSPWPEWKFGLQGTLIKYRYGWIYTPMLFAPSNAQELLIGANVVFQTLDEGLNWKAISPDLTRDDKSKQQRPGGPISADVTSEEMFDTLSVIAVSPLSDNTIWTGSDDGLVYVTTDHGGHWNQVRPPKLPTWSTITSIEPSHTEAGAAYVTASRFMWDDFHPYVYKTGDYGKTWTAITTGVPEDEYTQSLRQDPDDPSLLFLGTSASVYFSLDNGGHWQPLSLNLPAVRVSDIQIQSAQHAVVISTFGRAYWVLDNLQFLEQLSSAQVSSDAPYLFKPQQSWLVTRRGGFGGAGVGGENLPAGATVFFNLPSNYSGQQVKLSFTDASGRLVNSVTLPEKPKKTNSAFEAMAPKPAELHAGMNSYLWNLRYPNATDIKGIFHSGFSASEPVGPEIMPGTYYVELSYDGSTQKQPFVVKLDPRLTTTQAQLQQRFDLLTRINGAITKLASNVNAALEARDSLEKAPSGKAVQQALANLNRDIESSVDLKIQAGEGALVYPPELRAHLSAISGQVAEAFVAPTAAMMQVANIYLRETDQQVARLQADVAAARAAVRR